MCARGEGGQRQNMTLLAEHTQRHIVFPSETLALILHGLCGAAGCWGLGGSCLPRGRFGRSRVQAAGAVGLRARCWGAGCRLAREQTLVAWKGSKGS